MPLSHAADRDLLHRRDITLRGYQRADGLFDVEAELTDTKTYGFANLDRGRIEAGEPLHGMSVRMTVDETLTIQAFEAAMDATPFAICPDIAPNFAALAGLRIAPGFLRQAAERVGGTRGCTHLRELLQQLATVAFQTTQPVRRRRAAQPAGAPAALLNTCHAYAENGPVVRRLTEDAARGETSGS